MVDLVNLKTLTEFIQQVTATYKGKTAFRWRPRFRAIDLSYQEIFQLSKVVAQVLREASLKKGDNVIIWAANSPFWVAGFFGIQLAGCTAVPLNVQSKLEFIKKIANITSAKFLLKSKFLPPVQLKSLDLETIKPTSDIEVPEVATRENALAEIVYTSGTTGFPKGVMLTHKNILANLRSASAVIEVSGKDRSLSILPLPHMFAQIAGLFLPMTAGARVTYPGAINSINIRKNLVEDKITKMAAVPEFLRLIVRRLEETPASLLFKLGEIIPNMALRRILFWPITNQFGGALTTIVSGGAPLDPQVGKIWEAMGIYILQGYGTTEAAPAISANSYSDRKITSVGKPLPDVKVKIAADGEILVRGPNVFPGYFKDPQKTKEAFVGSWYKTGDSGFFDKDGHLYIRGRKKYMIVTEAGENVYPEDIEFELAKFPRVLDSCVVGLTRGGKTIVHAVLLAHQIQRPQNIILEVNKRLASHQQIQDYSIWPFDDFPRTVTKKVKRDEVIAYLATKIIKEEEFLPATTGVIEKCLAQITNLAISQITESKKLVADLKMDSLERVELVAAIEQDSGIILDEAEIGPATTVADIKEKVVKGSQKIERHKFRQWPTTKSVLLLRKIFQSLFLDPAVVCFTDRKVYGLENLSRLKLPAIFAANHISAIDPAVIVTSLPAKIRARLAIAAASDVIFETKKYQKYKNFLTFLINVFPFSRVGQIKSSLDYTGRLLDRGFSILVFPEGKVSETGKPAKLKEGTGFLAVEMQVPTVPIKIKGSEKVVPPGTEFPCWPQRGKVEVVFGKPLTFPPEASYLEATEKIAKAMKLLKT